MDFDSVMELTDNELDMYKRLTNRVLYLQDLFGNEQNYKNILRDIILEARYVALSRIFPFDDYSTKEVPSKYLSWQYRCCIELYNLADKRGFTSYSENGWGFGKLTDGISQQLLDEITSHVGVPKQESEE